MQLASAMARTSVFSGGVAPKMRRQWRRHQRGIAAIEYALLGAVVALGILVGLSVFGDAVLALYGKVQAAVLAAL